MARKKKSSKRDKQLQRNRKKTNCRMESLETREMLSSMSFVDDGVLTVTGTEEADTISAHVEEDQLIVGINGAQLSFNNNVVSHIHVQGLAGNDSIDIDDSVRQT